MLAAEAPKLTPEEPKLTPEERVRIADIEKDRAFSVVELLKGGAEYVVDENGEKHLKLSENQEKTF